MHVARTLVIVCTICWALGSISRFTQFVQLCVVVTKTINNEFLKYITSFERDFHSQEQHSRRECLDIVSIPSRLSTTNRCIKPSHWFDKRHITYKMLFRFDNTMSVIINLFHTHSFGTKQATSAMIKFLSFG